MNTELENYTTNTPTNPSPNQGLNQSPDQLSDESNPILPVIQTINKICLRGPFGTGKTSLALERIRWLLSRERIRGDDILVLAPQRTSALPYYDALRRGNMPPGAPVRVTTFAGLARSSVELYWPLLAPTAKFHDPHKEPTFLNLETSQYHMARFVDDALDPNAIKIATSQCIINKSCHMILTCFKI